MARGHKESFLYELDGFEEWNIYIALVISTKLYSGVKRLATCRPTKQKDKRAAFWPKDLSMGGEGAGPPSSSSSTLSTGLPNTHIVIIFGRIPSAENKMEPWWRWTWWTITCGWFVAKLHNEAWPQWSFWLNLRIICWWRPVMQSLKPIIIH